MLRSSPMNYIITTVIGGVMFVVTGFIVGVYLGNSVSLLEYTIIEFVRLYRILLVVAAILGIGLSWAWYLYGSRENVIGRLRGAARLWNILFAVGLFIAIGVVAAFVFFFRGEIFTLVQYIIMFTAISLNTYLLFWICTLFFSPRRVSYIPLGRR